MTEFRIVLRVYVRGQLRSLERVSRPISEIDSVITEMAEKHAEQCLREPTMIEFEFLDEPDPSERFFRIGTDPNGMLLPMRVTDAPAQTIH